MKKPRQSTMALVIAVCLAAFWLMPGLARARSLLLMTGYDLFHKSQALSRDTNMEAHFTLSGHDLYPRLITFNADAGMSAWLEQPVRFTVAFTFGDFAPGSDHSRFYDPADELYGAYLGAYYLQGLGHDLGASEVAKMAEFDQRHLALPALGLPIAQSHFTVRDTQTWPQAFANLNWTAYEATVLTNCPDHTPTGFRPAYLQFGWPPSTDRQFPGCELAARITVTRLAEQDLTIGLFVLAPSRATMARLDSEVLNQVRFA